MVAAGWRESRLDPKAYNGSGQVKGIFQWSCGGINGNRYKDTQDTCEAQMDLAIKELKTTHSATLDAMSRAKDIEASETAWDVNFEGLSVSDGQRNAEQVVANAKKIKEVYKLDFAGSIKTPKDNKNDDGKSADKGATSDFQQVSTGCSNTVSNGAADGTGEVKESGLQMWLKDKVPDDIKPYLHDIGKKKLDWESHTTADAYNQCAGFSQTYMNAIW